MYFKMPDTYICLVNNSFYYKKNFIFYLLNSKSSSAFENFLYA